MDSPKKMSIFKVVLLGSSGVGKSNLLSRLNGKGFSEEFRSTIGVEFLTKIIEVDDDVKVKAQIWDTAGQERFSQMMGTYYRNAKGALLVYDVADLASFKAIDMWKEHLLDHASPNVAMVLAGNKIDLEEHEVSREGAKKYAEENGMHFFETSAKTNANVTQAFTSLVAEIYARNVKKKDDNIEEAKNTVKLGPPLSAGGSGSTGGSTAPDLPCACGN